MQIVADPATQAALWKRARSMCARAVAAVGEPASLATRNGLSRQAKHDIAVWLARLESIVRKLLLALATALLSEARDLGNAGAHGLRPRTGPSLQAHAPQARPEAARSTLDLSAPETWSARFALATPRDPRAIPESHAPRIRSLWNEAPPPAASPQTEPRARHVTEPALRFAFRLEALKRVLADPIPYARRLACIFTRLLRRYPEAAHRYAIAPARPHAFDEGDPRLIVDVLSLAMAAAHLFPNTS
jgi:hypothetical protein